MIYSTKLPQYATEILKTILSPKSELFLGVGDFAIETGEVMFVASGEETAHLILTIDGTLRNDGSVICSELRVNGKLINNGTIQGGAYNG